MADKSPSPFVSGLGWQILAANVGGTVFSGGMGFLVARTNDGAPIWVLIALSLVGLPVLNRALAAHPPGT